jgi:capsule polysaccharide export protein KpsE/RkpR
MKKYLVALCAAALVAAATAGALGLPGGGGKVDTKKFDELIAKIEAVAKDVEEAKAKIDGAETTLISIAQAHGIADLLSDPANVATLKSALTEEEKAQLQAQLDGLASISEDLNAAVETSSTLLAEVPPALTDLVDQITKNPLAAKDLKDKQQQLEQGKTALEQVATDAPALVESATSLSATVAGMM